MDDVEPNLSEDARVALELIQRGPCRYVDVVHALDRQHARAQGALHRLEHAGEIRWLSNGWLVLPRRRIHPARDSNAVPLFDDERDSGPARRGAGDAAREVRSEPAAGGRRA